METQFGYQVFEVFIQRTHLDSHLHVGSLIAPSVDIAVQTARENFLRRDRALNIWVIHRDQITQISEKEFLSREMDRSYREVSGYTENGRLWRMFKERALTLNDVVDFVLDPKENSQKKGG